MTAGSVFYKCTQRVLESIRIRNQWYLSCFYFQFTVHKIDLTSPDEFILFADSWRTDYIWTQFIYMDVRCNPVRGFAHAGSEL